MKKLFILFTLFFLICLLSFATEKSYTLHELGTIITADNCKFSLNSIRWESGDNMFLTPDSGTKWLVLDCTIQNTSNETIFFSTMLFFNLFDKAGYAQNLTVYAPRKGNLDTSIAPSQTVRGEVAYVVDESASYWEFVFKPTVMGDDQFFYSIVKEQIK